MAVASIVPGAEVSIDQIDMEVDGLINPNFKFRSIVGEEQIEDGTNIHDHYIALPDTIKMTGIVDSIRSNADRAVECWKKIRKLHQEGTVMKLVTEFGVWEEVVIRTAETTQQTRGLVFTIELQQINRVTIGRRTISPHAPGNPVATRQPAVETGVKEPTPIEPTPIVINPDGTVRTGLLGEQSRTDVLKTTDAAGNSRFVLKKDK